MKRLISALLAILMICSGVQWTTFGYLFSAVAEEMNQAQMLSSRSEEFRSGSWIYCLLKDNIVSVEGYEGSVTSLKIPTEIDGHPVGAIADGAFADQPGLTSVTIPTQVFSIGAEAFSNPLNLRVTCYDGSAAQAWAKEQGAKVNSLTSMDLNSGVVDLSGVRASDRRVSGSRMYINTALSYVLTPGTVFFFEGTDKYGMEFWGGRVVSVQHEAEPSITFEMVDKKVLIDKLVASSDMPEMKMEFVLDPNLKFDYDDDVEATKVNVDVGKGTADISDKLEKVLIDAPIKICEGFTLNLKTQIYANYYFMYDLNLFAKDEFIADMHFDITTTIKGSASVSKTIEKKLGDVTIYGIKGFRIYAPVYLNITASGSIEVEIKDLVTVDWDYNSIKNKAVPKPVMSHETPTRQIVVQAELMVGLELGVGVDLLNTDLIYLGIEGGVKGIAKVMGYGDPRQYCLDFDLRLYGALHLKIDLVNYDERWYYILNDPVFHWHFEVDLTKPQTVKVDQCTRGNKTIHFELNGGEMTDSFKDKSVAWNSSFFITGPTRKNCKFLGWFLNKDLTQAWKNGSKVTNNITLYAAWYVPVSGLNIQQSDVIVYTSGNNSRVRLNAAISPSDASNKAVRWYSSNNHVARVDENGNVSGVAPGTATITAKSPDNTNKQDTCTVTVRQYVTAIDVSAAARTLIRKDRLQLSAKVGPDTAYNKAFTWSSGNNSIATVDQNGVVTGVKAGKVTIYANASDGSGVKGVIELEVLPIEATSIKLDQNNLVVNTSGDKKQIQITGTVYPLDADDQDIVWSSSNKQIATVNQNGVVTGVKAGTCTITAASHGTPGIIASCNVTVKQLVNMLKMNDAAVKLDAGQTRQLNVSVSPADATDKSLQWTSSNTAVATVSASGVVKAINGGTAVISAKTQDGTKIVCQSIVTVNGAPAPVVKPDSSVSVSSITMDMEEVRIFSAGACKTVRLNAVVSPANAGNPAIKWSSSNPSVATVDQNGVVTGVAGGTAVITATSAANASIEATCIVSVGQLIENIAVTPGTKTILKGDSFTVKATVHPANALSHEFVWTSENSNIATVDQDGIVTGVGLGTTNICAIAQDGSGVTNRISVTVNPVPVASVAFVKHDAIMYTTGAGKMMRLETQVLPLHAEDRNLKWSSSNPAVVSVDAQGVVTALAVGTATVRATSVSNPEFSDVCTITVKQLVTDIALNTAQQIIEPEQTVQVNATVSPANASDPSLKWTSTDENVARVSQTGLVTGVREGTATICAAASDISGVYQEITITVMEHPVTDVVLDKDSAVIYVGSEQNGVKLNAVVKPENASIKHVTWTSSDEYVATVDALGYVKAIAPGKTTITVSSDANPMIYDTCEITVKQMVSSVTVLTDSNYLLNGDSVQMSAVVLPVTADNPAVVWKSSDTSVATVTQNGLVKAVGEGVATITAEAQDGSGKSGMVNVTVEKWLSISSSVSDKTVYLDGMHEMELGQMMLSKGTVSRMMQQGLKPVWTLTGGQQHTTVTLSEQDVSYQLDAGEVSVSMAELKLTGLKTGGTDTYTLTCQIGEWAESVSFRVTCDDKDYADTISLGFQDVTVNLNETVQIPAVPVTADGKALPAGMTFTLSGDAVESGKVIINEKGAALSFSESSVNNLTVLYQVENLRYELTVLIRVKGADGLVRLPVQTVLLSAGQADMLIGEQLALKAEGRYGGETIDCDFTWTTNNEAIATVDQNGVVRAVGSGLALITATSGNASANCLIRVGEVVDIRQDGIEVDVYLGGDENVEIANVTLTTASSEQLRNMNVQPVWSLEKSSGDAAELAVQELDYNITDSIVFGSLLRLVRCYHAGETTFILRCQAEKHQCEIPVVIRVISPAVGLPESVSLKKNAYTAKIGESITVDLTSVVNPANTALPGSEEISLAMEHSFSNAVQNIMLQNGQYTMSFSKSGVFTARVRFSGGNYAYEAPFTVTVYAEDGTLATPVQDITITPDAQYLLVGAKLQLAATVEPADADNQELIWTSFDENVATVSQTGLVTAVGPGTTIIHATNALSEAIGECTIQVESVLSMEYDAKTIDVYLDGMTRTLLDTFYLTYASSARSEGQSAVWSLERVSGSCLTLKHQETQTVHPDGTVQLGANIYLYNLTRTGEAVYNLKCTVGSETAITRITVNAKPISGQIPSDLRLSQTEYRAKVNELIVFEPVITAAPAGIAIPGNLRVAFEMEDNAIAALNAEDYYVSRARSTFSFHAPGTYYADCVYISGNIRYVIPVTFRIEDEHGFVPVFATSLRSNPSELSLDVGSTAQLQAVFSPLDTSDTGVTFTSTDPAVANVTADGLVTAVGYGYAQIILTPSDSHVDQAVCNLVVENGFNVVYGQTSTQLYLQGEQKMELTSCMLSGGTMNRLVAQGLTPEWSVTRKSGNAATFGVLISDDQRTLTLETETLSSAGTDVYTIACKAGTYLWTQDFTLEIIDLGASMPKKVSFEQPKVTLTVNETRTINLAPVCKPAGSKIPEELAFNSLILGLGNFYDYLDYDKYNETEDTVTVCFTEPGTYLVMRTWMDCNLLLSAMCEITVTGNAPANVNSLLEASATEYTVYDGGASAIASTVSISDTLAAACFSEDIVWKLDRISGSSVTAALIEEDGAASLYVANAKQEGTDVWRITCTIGGHEESVDITIHAVMPRAELPEKIILTQDSFQAVANEWIYISQNVDTMPQGSRLPDTGADFWHLEFLDQSGLLEVEVLHSDAGMKVRFGELGSYSGTVIYESGNVRHEVPVYFYIVDEKGELPGYTFNLVSESSINRAWMDGMVDVGILNLSLVDTETNTTNASAAIIRQNGAKWGLTISSGADCGKLRVVETTPGCAKVVLESMSKPGTICFAVTCTVEGKTYRCENTLDILDASVPKPDVKLGRSQYTIKVGNAVSIDRRILDAGTGVRLLSANDENWRNQAALSAMGYGYESGPDTWLVTFYEQGSFPTTVDITVGNLKYNLPLVFEVLDVDAVTEMMTLRIFGVLTTVEEEAFYGISAETVDLRNSKVTTIGKLAFAGNQKLSRVYLPSSISSIADDAFAGAGSVLFICPEGSYAASWADDNGYPIEYSK